MSRTLETAPLSFQPLLERLQIMAWPDLRENGSSNASKGSFLEFLKSTYANSPVDFSLVPDGRELQMDDSRNARIARSRRVKKDLVELIQQAAKTNSNDQWKGLPIRGCESSSDDIEILVVSHSNFLKDLTNGRGFWPTEFRTFELAGMSNVELGEANTPEDLIETKESKERHLNGLEKPDSAPFQ